MTKWERLRCGKSAKYPAFRAQAVDRVDSSSRLERETAQASGPLNEETVVTSRYGRQLILTSVDPYGYLDVRWSRSDRPTLGTFLSRNAEKGDVLGIYTTDIITSEELYDGRDRRFIAVGNHRNEHQQQTQIIGDGRKGKDREGYVRDHPSYPAEANTTIELRLRGGRPELVVVARTRILAGQEAFGNRGLDQHLFDLRRSKGMRSDLIKRYVPE